MKHHMCHCTADTTCPAEKLCQTKQKSATEHMERLIEFDSLITLENRNIGSGGDSSEEDWVGQRICNASSPVGLLNPGG